MSTIQLSTKSRVLFSWNTCCKKVDRISSFHHSGFLPIGVVHCTCNVTVYLTSCTCTCIEVHVNLHVVHHVQLTVQRYTGTGTVVVL